MTLTLVSVVAALGVPAFQFVRSVRERGTWAIVLASFPWALLLITAGVVSAAGMTVLGFRRIAESAHGSGATIGTFSLLAIGQLRAGMVSGGLCILTAALLQIAAQRISIERPMRSTFSGAHAVAAPAGLGRAGWLLLSAPLLVLPAASVHVEVHALLDQILGIAAATLRLGAPAPHFARVATGDSIALLGESIAEHLMFACFGGGVLMLMLALVTVGFTLFLRFAKDGLAIRLYSFLVAGVLCIGSVAAIADLSSDITWLQRTLEGRVR
jgi:hypothetical protein